MSTTQDTLPDDVDALKAALAAERAARQAAEAKIASAEAIIAHLKLMIAKARHSTFAPSAERGRKVLDQLEQQAAAQKNRVEMLVSVAAGED